MLQLCSLHYLTWWNAVTLRVGHGAIGVNFAVVLPAGPGAAGMSFHCTKDEQ